MSLPFHVSTIPCLYYSMSLPSQIFITPSFHFIPPYHSKTSLFQSLHVSKTTLPNNEHWPAKTLFCQEIDSSTLSRNKPLYHICQGINHSSTMSRNHSKGMIHIKERTIPRNEPYQGMNCQGIMCQGILSEQHSKTACQRNQHSIVSWI